MRFFTLITITVILIVVISPVLFATIINIPDDYPTIQEGIDASENGDTVLVQPGTYVENINFNGHNIVLGSLFLTTGDTLYISATIIDGDGAGTVVRFENEEDITAVITGFTIQNGYGGVFCHNSSPTLRNNIVTSNFVVENGAGIHCRRSNPLIIYNKIWKNRAWG